MPYTQKFSPKGNDLEVLNFFRERVISGDFEGPGEQTNVAHQIYDMARAYGAKPGGVSVKDLDSIYTALRDGKITPDGMSSSQGEPSPIETMDNQVNDYADHLTALWDAEDRGSTSELYPRTAQQAPYNTMRPTRHIETGDTVADAAGAAIYQLIDGLTLGAIGGLGWLVKKTGLTEENFWSESIGEADNILGLDFGRGGIKEGDTNAGKWAGAAGGLVGFVAPMVASGGLSVGAKVLGKGVTKAVTGQKAAKEIAKKLATKAVEAKKLGDTAAAAEHIKDARLAGDAFKRLSKQVVKKEAKLAAHQERSKKIVSVLGKFPATQVFKQSHKVLDKVFMGKNAPKVVRNIVANITKSEPIKGLDGAEVPWSSLAKHLKASAKLGVGAGYKHGRLQSQSVLRGLVKEGAEEIGEAVATNPAVSGAARAAFKGDLSNRLMKELGLDPKNFEHLKMVEDIAERASKLFLKGFNGMRKQGGLLALNEQAVARGAGGFTTGVAKLVEESANHITGMVALGLATRTMHPLAEPDTYGINDDDLMETAKQVSKFWLKGAGGSPFEGVMGDVLVGTAFGTGGGLKLLSAFNTKQISNPQEVFSNILGGNAGKWKAILDTTDTELSAIYKFIHKVTAATEKDKTLNPYKMVTRWLRRNRADYRALEDQPKVLKQTARMLLKKIENTGTASGIDPANIGFSETTIDAIGKDGGAAARQVTNALSSHLEKVFRNYKNTHMPNLLRDMVGMAAVTTATSYVSNPHLWHASIDGDADIHPSALVVHTLFAGMMARQPYYSTAGSPYFSQRTADAPMTRELKNQLAMQRSKDMLRHYGVRDHAFFLDRPTKMAEYDGVTLGPRTSFQMLKDAGEDYRTLRDGLIGGTTESRRAAFDELMKKVEVVKSQKDITDPAHQVTEREVIEFKQLLDHEYLANQRQGTDADGNPYESVFGDIIGGSGEELPPWMSEENLNSNTEHMRSMLHTLVNYRNRLKDGGYIGENEPFSFEGVVRANSRWYENLVVKSGNTLHGLAKDMTDQMASGTEGLLEYLKVHEDGQFSNNENMQAVVSGYTELLNIMRDLNIGKIKVGNTNDPQETARILDLTEEGGKLGGKDLALYESMEGFVKLMEGTLAKELGIKNGVRLGSDGNIIHHMIMDGLGRAGINHNMMFFNRGAMFTGLTEGGTGVYNFDRSIINALVESGAVVSLGKGEYVAKSLPVDMEGTFEVIGGNKRKRYELLSNLWKILDVKGITISSGKDPDMVMKPEAVDALFGVGSRYKGIMSALEGNERIMHKKGMFGVLQDLGIMVENDRVTHDLHQTMFYERHKDVTASDRMLLDGISSSGLEHGVGWRKGVAQPAVAAGERAGSENRSIDIEGGREFTYEEAAESISSENLIDALTPLQRETLNRGVALGVKIGRWSGAQTFDATIDPATGGAIPVREGKIRVFADTNDPALEQLRLTLDTYESMSTGEFFKNLEMIQKGFDKARTGKGMSRKQRKLYYKLATIIQKIGDNNSWAWHKSVNLMFNEGKLVTTTKKGDKVFRVQSEKELDNLIKKANDFYDTIGQQEAEASDQLSRMQALENSEAFKHEFKRKRDEGTSSVSDFLLDTGIKANPFEEIAFITDVKGIVDGFDPASGDNVTDLVRQRAHASIEKLFGDSAEGDRLRTTLDSYSRNTIRGLANQMSQTEAIIDMVPGSTLMMSRQLRIPVTPIESGAPKFGNFITGAPGNMQRGDYRAEWTMVGSESNVVRVGKRLGLSMMNVHANMSIPGRTIGFFDNPDAYTKYSDKGYTGELTGAMRIHGTANGVAPFRFVMGEKFHESGGGVAMKLPIGMGERVTLADAVDHMVSRYEHSVNTMSETSLGQNLGYIIPRLKYMSEQLRDADLMDGDLYNGNIKWEGRIRRDTFTGEDKPMAVENRKAFFEELLDFTRLHDAFGHEALIAADMEYTASPRSNPWPKLYARMKLHDNRSSTSFNTHFIREALAETIGEHRLDRSWGAENVNDVEYVTVMVADDVTVGKTQGRIKVLDADEAGPRNDSGIYGSQQLMETFARAFGINVGGEGGNHNVGVQKLQITGTAEDGLTLGTKNLMIRRLAFDNTMAQNGVGLIISRSAIKHLAAKYGNGFSTSLAEGDYARVEGTNDIDIWSAQTAAGENGLKLTGRKIRIPISAFRAVHPIDANPAEAAKSAQLGNMKTHRFVEAMVGNVFDRQRASIIRAFKHASGGFDTTGRMSARAILYGQQENMSAQELSKPEVRGAFRYLDQGGDNASPTHFGFADYYLDHMKKSIIDDHMFKIRTGNGSSGVYVADDKNIINPSEAILSHAAGERTIGVDEAHIGFIFDGETPEAVEQRQRVAGGFKGKTRYNRPGTGQDPNVEIAPDTPTNVVHFKAFEPGEQGGIAPGLIKMYESRASIASRPPRYTPSTSRGSDPGGAIDGATATHGLFSRQVRNSRAAKALAVEVSSLWQDGLQTPKAGTWRVSMSGRVRKVVGDAIDKGDVTLAKGQSRDDLINGVASELSRALEAAHVGNSGNAREMLGLWSGGRIKHRALHNSLSYIFGGYDYAQRKHGSDQGKGSVSLGVSATFQRHPSTMMNDTIPGIILGYTDPREGNQTIMSPFDAERKMKADVDEDHINWWFDSSRAEFKEIIRNRGVTGGFAEVKVPQMERQNPFKKNVNKGDDFSFKWVQAQRWGKAGIGLTSKAISAASVAMQKEIYGSYVTDRGVERFIAPLAMFDAENGAFFYDGMSMDRHQEGMQDRMARITNLLNMFLDTKHGASKDVKNLKLQELVMKEFYGVYEKGADGKIHLADGGFEGRDMRYLKEMMGPIYNITSVGSGLFENGGMRSHRLQDLLFKFGRYNAVMGHGVDQVENLTKYVHMGINNNGKYRGRNTPMDERLAKFSTEDLSAGNSFKILTKPELLERRSLYDGMAEMMAQIEGDFLSDFNQSFLLQRESDAFSKGMKFISGAAPEQMLARASGFNLDVQGRSDMVRYDERRMMSQHEDLLDAEVERARMYLGGVSKFWKDHRGKKNKKFQPQSKAETRRAMEYWGDSAAIQVIRRIISGQDKADGRTARMRLAAAMAIRSERDADMARQINQSKFGADTEQLMTDDIKQAKLEVAISEYLAEYGKDGNEMVAMFDLLYPKSDGHFNEKGMQFAMYRKFPVDIYNTTMNLIGGGSAGFGVSPTGMGKDWGNALLGDTHKLMAYVRSTVDAVISGDTHVLMDVKDMIEAQELDGQTLNTAFHARDIGKWEHRLAKRQNNIYLAAANRGLDLGKAKRPRYSGVNGFRSLYEADRFVNLLAAGELPHRMKMRIMDDWNGTQTSSPFPKEYMDTISEMTMQGSWLFKIGQAPRDFIGQSAFKRGISSSFERDVKRELLKEDIRKKPWELDQDEIDRRVGTRESKFFEHILKALGIQNGDTGTLIRSGVSGRFKHDHMSGYLKEGRFKDNC